MKAHQETFTCPYPSFTCVTHPLSIIYTSIVESFVIVCNRRTSAELSRVPHASRQLGVIPLRNLSSMRSPKALRSVLGINWCSFLAQLSSAPSKSGAHTTSWVRKKNPWPGFYETPTHPEPTVNTGSGSKRFCARLSRLLRFCGSRLDIERPSLCPPWRLSQRDYGLRQCL